MLQLGKLTFFSTLLWVGLVLLLLANGLISTWSINVWSVAYLDQRLGEGKTAVALPGISAHKNARFWLARDALRTRDITLVKQLLQTADSQNIFVQDVWGYLLAQEGNYEGTIETWVNANDFQALLKLKNTSIENGNLQLARMAYDGLVDVQPEETVWAYAEFFAHRMNNYDEAEALLAKSIVDFPLSPKTTEWKYRLGQLYSEENRWDDAHEMFADVLKIKPNHYWALINLGNVAHYRGDGSEKAIEWFHKAIEVNPNQGAAYYDLARILTQEGSYTEADK